MGRRESGPRPSRQSSDSAQGLLPGLPKLRLTSSCSLSLSPASRRSLPLDFSSAPAGAVAEGCWDCTGVLSRPPSSISTTTAGLLRAHLFAPPLFPDGLAPRPPDRKRPVNSGSRLLRQAGSYRSGLQLGRLVLPFGVSELSVQWKCLALLSRSFTSAGCMVRQTEETFELLTEICATASHRSGIVTNIPPSRMSDAV